MDIQSVNYNVSPVKEALLVSVTDRDLILYS